MSYIVLARKYRPQKFEDVVGQSHVCQILKNSITQDRIGHAYLFAGQRGIGKTTIARIFAKALNCKKGPTPTPCEECVNCKEITEGNSIDVLEIDAASNRGVDEIRAIRDNVKFASASSKHKIYIIDEAHQITDVAFNALLKTLEEPPAHIVFILATTEPQKIPLTILSRCQRFSLRPIPTEDIIAQLDKIVKKEKFNIDKDAVALIAQTANGSIRDSLSMLDQVVSISPDKKVVSETVRELLGLGPVELVSSFLDLVASRDARGVLTHAANIAERGYDFVQFSRDLREYVRKLIFISLDKDEIIIKNLLPEEKDSLRKQKDKFTIQELVRTLRLLNRCVGEIRWSDNPRLIFELYSLRLVQPVPDIDGLIARVEDIEQRIQIEKTGLAPAAPIPLPPVQKNPPVKSPVEQKKTSVKEENIDNKWRNIVEEVRKKKPIVASILESAPVRMDSPNTVKVFLPEGFHLDTVKNFSNFIESTIARYFTEPVKLKCEISSSKQPSKVDIVEEITSEEQEEKPTEMFEIKTSEGEATDETSADPGLKKILKAFSGKIIR